MYQKIFSRSFEVLFFSTFVYYLPDEGIFIIAFFWILGVVLGEVLTNHFQSQPPKS